MSLNRRYQVSPSLFLRVVFTSLLSLLLCGALCRSAQASGTFVPATQRVDMVHDAARGVLYITNGGSVLRYHLGTKSFLSPFVLGGNLGGIDLSPDGNLLAVADATRTENQIWIHLVNLQTGTSTQAFTARAFYEGGTFTVAFANDGSIVVTSTFEGSGWVPMRRYYPGTGNWTVVANSVRHNTMLRANADKSIIGFAESDNSDGPFGRYRISDGDLLRRQGYDSVTGGTGAFNYEIAVNKDATQFAILTSSGTYIYNANLARVWLIGTDAGERPVGVVYHPNANIVYFAMAGTTQVRAYNTFLMTEIASYNFENQFDDPRFYSFVEGRLRISNDGNYLFATVAGGVRYIYVGPNTAPVAVDDDIEVNEDSGSSALNLLSNDSDANGDALRIEGYTNPAHGTINIVGDPGNPTDLAYTPNANFAGEDSFQYVIGDGNGGTDTATVYITVHSVNDAPVANAGADQTLIATGLLTSVSLDGSASYDVDGDALAFTWRKDGALVASGATPTVNLPLGTHTLVLKVSDPSGAWGQDTVVITVNVPGNTPNAKANGSGTLPDTAVSSPTAQGKKPTGITFKFSVTNDKKGFKGSLSYGDPQNAKVITATSISNMTVSGTQATIYGVASVNGSGAHNFVLQVNDLAKKGAGVDTFALSLSNGYTVSGALKTGNITVQAK